MLALYRIGVVVLAKLGSLSDCDVIEFVAELHCSKSALFANSVSLRLSVSPSPISGRCVSAVGLSGRFYCPV